jgi:ribose transport system permease protein
LSTTFIAAAPVGARSRAVQRLLANGTLISAGMSLALFAVFAARQPAALTASGITDLFNNALPLALAAAGSTLVVLTRGFDLSVAGVVSLANVLVVTAIGEGRWAPLLGLVIVVAVGFGVGAVNGVLVAHVGLQSVTATLATMIICSGAALLILDFPGGDVHGFIAEELTGTLGGSLPVAALIAMGVIASWAAIRRTDWGVALYAVGADESAAALAGISTRQVKLRAYCLAGVLYGLAGYMLTALTATGDPNAGNPYLILTYAAIAIGGTSFAGGRGGLVGSMIGALTLGLLQKVLFSFGVLSIYTGIAHGIVMILAVAIAGATERLARRGRA